MISYADPQNHVVAWLDPAKQQLDVAVTARGRRTDHTAPLPSGFTHATWHTVAAERRAGRCPSRSPPTAWAIRWPPSR